MTQPVALYGGAFDPVTFAHLAVAERVAAEGFRVVFLPCADEATLGKRPLPARDRVALLRLALADRFETSSLEIELGHSRTIDTWPAALRRFGPVHWVIGSDHAACMDRWHEGARLRAELSFLVTERAGHPLADAGAWCRCAPHRFLPSHGAALPLSSTAAREAIRAGRWDDVARMVPNAVRAAIRANDWYAVLPAGGATEAPPVELPC